jgi:hypothetical protein
MSTRASVEKATRVAGAVLAWCLCADLPYAAAQPPAETKLKDEYHHAFKGDAKPPKDWEVMGPEAELCVKFETSGLKISLPAGQDGAREDTGLVKGWAVKGDFEITVEYEILREPAAGDGGNAQTRFSLTAGLERAESNMASLSHMVGDTEGNKYVAWMKDQPNTKLVPAAAKGGRLRLERSGSELRYSVSEASEEDFTILDKRTFGSEDLKFISFGGSTGGEKASLDVRITDLRIRAESLPGLAAPEPRPVTSNRPPPKPAPTTAPQAAAGGLELGWIVGIAAVVLGLGAGAWLYFRRKKSEAEPSKEEPAEQEEEPAPQPARAQGATISCPCPGCGERLKVRAALVGKRVRCPECNTRLLVPRAKTEA